jgi:hypothetical protein
LRTDIDLYPFSRDLDQCFAKVAVEAVFPAALFFQASPQDALEGLGRDQFGKRCDACRLDIALDERRDGGMDLVPTQSQGLRRKRPRSGVGGKWIGPATPLQVIIHILAERSRQQCPVDPLGRAAKGGDGHWLEIEPRQPRHLIPDQRHLPVQVIWVAVQRTPADGGDEAFHRGVVDLVWFDPPGAGEASEPREANMRPLS